MARVTFGSNLRSFHLPVQILSTCFCNYQGSKFSLDLEYMQIQNITLLYVTFLGYLMLNEWLIKITAVLSE